ncbi:MAG: hypothetical protein HY646_19440 [Acidobacteria bacterium]|nr:hypothetical protein [Acidobacteriota bacterium]
MLSPILAGFLLESGAALPSVAMIMSIGSLLAAFVLIFLRLGAGGAEEATEKKPGREASMARSQA